MEILIDDKIEDKNTYTKARVPARAPLSDMEWNISKQIWPVVRPNCPLGKNNILEYYFSK